MELTEGQRKKLSDISADIAQVVFASIAIPFLIDKFDLAMILLGLETSAVFWLFSLIFARG